ncbi:hypothetical protein D3C87_1304030 [compost metagenome]
MIAVIANVGICISVWNGPKTGGISIYDLIITVARHRGVDLPLKEGENAVEVGFVGTVADGISFF